jgi:hypothetical protein
MTIAYNTDSIPAIKTAVLDAPVFLEFSFTILPFLDFIVTIINIQ